MSFDSNSDVISFRWEIVDFRKQWEEFRKKKEMFFSGTFQLIGQPSVQFALYVDTKLNTSQRDSAGVILKQAVDKPIEARLKIWVESIGGQKFGETFVRNHMFCEFGYLCGFNGIPTSNRDFWDLYNKHETFFICCEVTDLNAHLFPTIGQYQEFLQNHLAFYEREMHDAVIKVNKTEFKVMKAFLMSQSEVFERMFLSSFKEGITNEIKIDDIDETTMKHFVKWFYTGKLEDDSPIEKLFAAADKYDVKLLKKMCVNRLLSTLTRDNVFNRLILAVMHSDTQFKEDVLDFIGGMAPIFFYNFSGSSEWLEFCVKNTEVAEEIKELLMKKMKK